MHGYNNFASDMHPFLVAAGFGVKKLGMVDLFYQVDVYPLVSLLLGLEKPNKIDGQTMRVVKYLSKTPSASYLNTFKAHAEGVPVPPMPPVTPDTTSSSLYG